MPSNERTPLLSHERNFWDFSSASTLGDFHTQFCKLVGVPPSNLAKSKQPDILPKTLYGRALHQRTSQNRIYNFTAALSNTLLLSQVVLGAAVTGLGASESSHILITVFGALNTIIAGLVAYLKSRGQPMRARMYRDDLERVVDEIENSEIMWLGISNGMHGYDAINTDDEVTVRSEVARLTRLYDRAVKNNTYNNPDMYMAGGAFDGTGQGLRQRPLPSQPAIPAIIPAAPNAPAAGNPAPALPSGPGAPVPDPDESPASAPPKPKEEPPKPEPPKEEPKPAAPAPAEPPKETTTTPAPEAAPPAAPTSPSTSPPPTEASTPPKTETPASAPAPAPAPAPAAPEQPANSTPTPNGTSTPSAAADATGPASSSAVAFASRDPDESPASSASIGKKK